MDAVRGARIPRKRLQKAAPAPALGRMDVRVGAHQADARRGIFPMHRPFDRLGGLAHRLKADIQPDFPVWMDLPRRQNAAHEFFPRKRLARALAVKAHMFLTKAAAPMQRRMVVQAKVVFNPQ